MRPIKFRAWWKDTMKPVDEFWDYSIDVLGNHEDNPFIISQSTGLLDKNGKEIYEGDILKLVCYQNVGKHSVRIVSFDKGCFGFKGAYDLKFWPLGIRIGNKGTEKIFEVIGNIYENPELMVNK